MMFNQSCEKITKVDKMLIKGKIYTLDADFKIAECIVINNDTIVEIGNIKEITGKYKADELIDLEGKSVYPGFNDAHCHLRTYAILSNLWLNLKEIKSFEQVLNRIVEYDRKYNYEYIAGRGWDQNLWDSKEMPDNSLLNKNFPDKPETKGILVESINKYNKICDFAEKYDFQVCTHAIGDSANRLILNIYKKYLEKHNDKRWRVEHAQVVNPEDIDMFGRYNIIPSVQATHATSDMYWAEERLGKERIKHAYAYKDLLKQNLWLPNGTDFPIENIDPLNTYYAAVCRKDMDFYPENGFYPDQALSRKEALYSICLWPAKAAFMEQYTGSLEEGKKADLVVLSQDIYSIPDKEIPGTKVLQTMINGEFLYAAP